MKTDCPAWSRPGKGIAVEEGAQAQMPMPMPLARATAVQEPVEFVPGRTGEGGWLAACKGRELCGGWGARLLGQLGRFFGRGLATRRETGTEGGLQFGKVPLF